MGEQILVFLKSTGFAGMTPGNGFMILVAIVFFYFAIKKHYEPLLLIPIGFGILIGNIPLSFTNISTPPLSYLYLGIIKGIYPPLIFLGLGALTDFSYIITNPKLILLGGAAQFGIFGTLIGALMLGFSPQDAGSIGIIGGADGPTAVFLAAALSPKLLAPIAIAAYSYMAMVPIIQPPIMKLLTTRKERLIRMKPVRECSRLELMIFPVASFLVCALIAPRAAMLLGMLFFGNFMKVSGVTDRLSNTAKTSFIDTVTILLGVSVGASASAAVFLTRTSISIFILGIVAFSLATASGVIFGKIMNLVSKDPVNPLLGAAGVSAVPDSARVVQMVGQKEDPGNFLLMHAMAPNVAGVIGSAIAAGVIWSLLG